MKKDYTHFDSLLIEKINSGARTLAALRGGQLERMADTLAAPDRFGDRQGWRVIDRRLQALRKAGKLAYDHKTGWSAGGAVS